MELTLSREVAENYFSESQRSRVMTEYWVKNSGFCPNCGSNLEKLKKYKPVSDFFARVVQRNMN
jgi:hypothetical protein